MKTHQIWKHMKRRNKDGVEGATLLYEIFYNRNKLVSRETYDSICEAFNTPICTGVTYGMQAKQIAERIKRNREESREFAKKRYLSSAEECLDNLVDSFGIGRIDGERFTVSYIPNKMLMLSMLNDGSRLDQLAESFSHIIGYKPFCKYTEPERLGSLKTYEWAKDDSIERLKALKKEGKKDILFFEQDARNKSEMATRGGRK